MNLVLGNVDPNWLMSTAAQSAAALVAIIGAFLFTRSLALAAERGTLLRRQREVSSRLKLETERLDEARRRLLIWDVQDLFIEAKEVIPEPRGNRRSRNTPRLRLAGWTDEDVESVLRRMLSVTRKAFERLESPVEPHAWEYDDLPKLRQELQIDLSPEDRFVYQEVSSHLVDEKDRNSLQTDALLFLP